MNCVLKGNQIRRPTVENNDLMKYAYHYLDADVNSKHYFDDPLGQRNIFKCHESLHRESI